MGFGAIGFFPIGAVLDHGYGAIGERLGVEDEEVGACDEVVVVVEVDEEVADCGPGC